MTYTARQLNDSFRLGQIKVVTTQGTQTRAVIGSVSEPTPGKIVVSSGYAAERRDGDKDWKKSSGLLPYPLPPGEPKELEDSACAVLQWQDSSATVTLYPPGHKSNIALPISRP